MKKKILVLGIVLSLVAILAVPTAVLAGNEGTQQATTTGATTISIKAQDYSADVATITFPSGTTGSTISLPTNGVGEEVQTFGDAETAKPVVTLVNSAAVAYKVWYSISAWDPADVVASESYIILAKGAACASADAITHVAVTDGTVTVDADATQIAATGDGGDADELDLYLKITLGDIGIATSTITILGETP